MDSDPVVEPLYVVECHEGGLLLVGEASRVDVLGPGRAHQRLGGCFVPR